MNTKPKNTELLRWPSVLVHQGVPSQMVYALQTTAVPGARTVARTKRAAASAMWMSDLPIEQIELGLTQHMRQRGDVAGAVRAIAEHTRDSSGRRCALRHRPGRGGIDRRALIGTGGRVAALDRRGQGLDVRTVIVKILGGTPAPASAWSGVVRLEQDGSFTTHLLPIDFRGDRWADGWW